MRDARMVINSWQDQRSSRTEIDISVGLLHRGIGVPDLLCRWMS
jgi:hypothetical protein